MSVAFAFARQRGKGEVMQQTTQKMLDENHHLIQFILDYQSKGKTAQTDIGPNHVFTRQTAQSALPGASTSASGSSQGSGPGYSHSGPPSQSVPLAGPRRH
ncbi:hypothetical protein EI555_012172 [Monodon monoceros]|uniref:SS18 N-terminal domain-containing protein n=1 Tax=Monodon monoceros TaxID=40151 RepID=A0A4U1EJJ3_MONMO|nr:hypothetical protein EI555_012172 [Monodon monoceros]